MKIMNKISMLVLALTAACAWSCTNDAEPTVGSAGEGAYFDTTKSVVEVEVDATSATVYVHRMETDAARTVALAVEAPEGVTAASSASFADGEDKAPVTFTFDEPIAYGESFSVSLAVADENYTTPYGPSSWSFTLTCPPPFETIGKATFYEWFLFEDAYAVELQRNTVNPNQFRLVDPYTEGLEAEEYNPDGSQSEYLTFEILQVGDTVYDTTVTMEDLVYFDRTLLFDYGAAYGDNYGPVYAYHPSAVYDDEADWTYNKVVSWQEPDENGDVLPAIVQLAPFYYLPALPYSWDYTQYDEVVYIVFPGVSLTDYSVEVKYTGRYVDTKGKNYAIADVTLGEDTESARVAIGSGSDYESLVDAVIADEIGYTTLTASGEVRLPVADGTWTIVAVSYAAGEDGSPEAKSYDYVTFKVSLGVDTSSPLEKEWDAEDLYEIEKDELFKTWNLWAVDYFDESNTDRQLYAEWTFSENEDDDDEDFDAVNMQGLSFGWTKNDTTVWEYYEGFVYYLGGEGFTASVSGHSLYFDEFIYDSKNDGFYSAGIDYAMVAGLVDDGYMAMVYSGDYGGNYNFDGYGFDIYLDDEEMGEDAYYDTELIYDIMLEDPAVATSTYAIAAAPRRLRASASLGDMKRVATAAAVKPRNFVELRGRERMHAIIDELKSVRKTTVDNYSVEVLATRKAAMKSKIIKL